ncbi:MULTISPECIES: hypothetical protein [Actinosynnema]|uniref:hypothetical protein n=1 Tax=Actinosynnema TaxID=40566 RepID=UPI0020A5C536|nr:hypothetical protein [Actinosynnema pretiosum]MCP2094007.1 Alpha/beta hydrolase family [Actinosynnema pretiosum]
MVDTPATAVLLHSPFLGPASLAPLADALAALGRPVLPLDVRVTVNAAPVHQRIIGVLTDAVEDSGVTGDLVLVGHSGAGPLLPAFAEALEEAPVTGLVYLDSDLPTPGRSWRDTAPAELFSALKAASRAGLLQRWDRWFGPDEIAGLVSDPDLLAEITAEAPEVPLAFLKEPHPTIEWTGPQALLRLSPAYDEACAQAAALGWPVRELDLHHLAAATDPEPVALALADLLDRLGR